MNETTTIEYELTESDLDAFCYFYANTSKGIVGIRKRAGIYGIIAIAAAVGFFYLWKDIFTLIVWAICAAFMWNYAFRGHAISRKIKKNFIKAFPPEQLFGKRKVQISSEDVSVESAGANSTFKWSMIRGVGHDDKHIFFYDTPGQNIVIPSRAFNNHSEFLDAYKTVQLRYEAAR